MREVGGPGRVRAETIHSGLRAGSIDGFITGLPLLFQRRPAAGLDATYHLTFTGTTSRTS